MSSHMQRGPHAILFDGRPSAWIVIIRCFFLKSLWSEEIMDIKIAFGEPKAMVSTARQSTKYRVLIGISDTL
jgi:hypothetical protein